MRVLYATDGSQPARQAERLITALFDPAKAEIRTFSVTPDPVYVEALPVGSFELAHMDVPVSSSEEIAHEAADHLVRAGFEVEWGSARGDPAVRILEEAERVAPDLIVLGASHTTWMGGVLLGSVGMHVLHHARSSVLLAHRAPSGEGKVLFGVDGSRGSSDAVDLALEVLDPEKCTLTFAGVAIHPWVSAGSFPPGPPLGSFGEYEAAERARVERAWAALERVEQRGKRAGFETHGSVLAGAPGPHLLKEADNIGADLVVVGSRGLGPVKRAFLGSVGDQIARHAPAALIGRARA